MVKAKEAHRIAGEMDRVEEAVAASRASMSEEGRGEEFFALQTFAIHF